MMRRAARSSLRKHWTYDTLSGGVLIISGYLLLRDCHGMPSIQKYFKHSDLPDATSDDLMTVIENELYFITKNQKYPNDRTDFKVMVSDNIESRTQGGFQHRYNALLRLSTRVALNDVQQIRENYPNLFKLFKENGLDKLDALDSSTLTDSDLQCILLSQNAKRFVIARELLYASSSRFLSPAFHSILGSLPSFALCYYLRTYTKSNDLFTFISSLAIGVVFIYFLLESYYRIETLYLDSEAAKIDEDHKEGCIDYLKSSIKLCKLLNKLTNGKSDFDKNGNYFWHSASYVERLERFNLDNKTKI